MKRERERESGSTKKGPGLTRDRHPGFCLPRLTNAGELLEKHSLRVAEELKRIAAQGDAG